MKTLFLKRVSMDLKQGTFGVLLDNDSPICVTVELPWNDNKKFESCIPGGYYICKRHESPSKGETFMLKEVPNRDYILFDVANTVTDLEGCIGVGTSFGKLDSRSAVLDSREAFKKFMYILRQEDSFALIVIDFWRYLC